MFHNDQVFSPLTTVKAICIIALIGSICIVAFILNGKINHRRKNQNATLSNQTESLDKPSSNLTPTASPELGLRVTRDFVISAIQKTSPDIIFSQSLPVKGQETYSAQVDQNTIKLLGFKENLNEISSTASLSDTTADRNVKALSFVIAVPNIIDPEAGAWVTSIMKDAFAAKDEVQASFERSTVIHQRKYTLSVVDNSILKYASITIDPGN